MTLVSVIVPVFNCAKYVAEAINSILDQAYHPLEVIVVDDGSTDESAVVVKAFEPAVTYTYQANGGIGSARNKGISMASGEYLAFLDADDIWVKDKLVRQMAVFDSNPEVDLVYGHVRQFFSPELVGQIEKDVQIKREIMPAQLASAMLIRRETFLRIGFYETKWAVGADQNWHMLAVDKKLNMVMLDDIVYWRRIHKNNISRRKQDAAKVRLHNLKAALDRRRQKDE